MELEQTVQKLIRKYKSNNPFEICNCLNIAILDMQMIDIRGLFICIKQQYFIFLDETMDEQERQFVCAHELAHFFLHKNVNRTFLDTRTFLKTSGYEKEADLFACWLLYPSASLEEYEGWTDEQVSNFWGVPVETVRQRFL